MLVNLFVVSTLQAIMFTSLVVIANSAIIGVNPFNFYKSLMMQWKEHTDFWNNMVVSDTSVIPGLPKGTKYSDLPDDLKGLMYEQSVSTVVLLDLIKVMGLSDKTILIIEQDLRN